MAFPAWAARASGKLDVPVYRLSRGRLMNKVGRPAERLLQTAGFEPFCQALA
jgi:hypothetical protein